MMTSPISIQELNTMKANIRGRLAKLADVPNYKIPMLEAVANSIQSLLSSKTKNPCITVKIVFESTATYPNVKNPSRYYYKIQDIEITDNGVGFNEKNFESFETMDSDLKALDFGCKGIGRFYWLKGFSSVAVDSVYLDKTGQRKRRQFQFSVDDIQSNVITEVGNETPIKTTVRLIGLSEKIRNKQEVTLDDVARVIVNHFLLDFVNKQVPEIIVTDGSQRKCVMDEFVALESTEPKSQKYSVGNYDFELIQQRLNVKAKKSMSSGIYYCAGSRVVDKANSLMNSKFESILEDEDGKELLYVGLLKSSMFDSLVNSNRTAIVYPEDSELDLYPSEREVLKQAEVLSGEYLAPELKRIETLSKHALDRFVDEEAPEYKGFLNKHAEELYVKPNSSSGEIRDYVSERYFQFERTQRKEINQLIDVEWSGEDAEEKIKEIETRVDPIAAHDLVKFAATRRFYLSMYKKAITLKDDGKYQREKIVHSLIFPMNTDSTSEMGMNKHNLWLIDDRLTFVNYLTSDQAFSAIPICNSDSMKRMDLAALKLYSVGPAERVGELYIIEFKRPGREDYDSDENPISQVLDYVDELRAGKIKAADGSEISNADKVPIFCFVVAQLTPKLKKQCRNSNLQMSATGDFYFGVVNEVYIEVYNLNSLYLKAKERNHALLKAAKLDDIY